MITTGRLDEAQEWSFNDLFRVGCHVSRGAASVFGISPSRLPRQVLSILYHAILVD